MRWIKRSVNGALEVKPEFTPFKKGVYKTRLSKYENRVKKMLKT